MSNNENGKTENKVCVQGVFYTSRYYNSENDYCIYVYTAKNTKQIPDGTSTFTAIGYGLPQNSSIEIEFNGSWKTTNFGKQLIVTEFKEILPTTADGIVGYLSSGLIKGIGKKLATDIVSMFGTDTITILEYDPKQLLKIPGITENRLNDIISSFKESRELKELVSFLSVYNISTKKAIKIQNHFKGNSLSVIKQNPFNLCEISGFGFITVDKIARSLNCALDDSLRIQEAIIYTLNESSTSGNLFLTERDLSDKAHELLNNGFNEEIVDRFHIIIEINAMVSKKILYDYDENIYLYNNFMYENMTAKNITKLLNARNNRKISNISDTLKSSQKKLGINLGTQQIKATEMCINNNLSIITGGPGTGKTTVLKTILDVYKNTFSGSVLLLAPTGRASRQMAESTGNNDASTIHKALGIMGDDVNSLNPTILDSEFIIVDEMSMVDMKLAYILFKSIRQGTKVLLLGDAEQLPSVGAGNVFRELITSNMIPTTKLDQIFRQGNDSLIPVNAQLVNTGNSTLKYGTDFQFISSNAADDTANLIKESYVEQIKKYDISKVQILTPLKSKTKASSVELNKVIQEIVNPKNNHAFEFKVSSHIFRVNDKVMQTKNINEISNGDVGIIKNITKENVTIEFSNNRIAVYTSEEMQNVDLAYAMTIHKSQGSEYDVVIIPILTGFYNMLKRNIIYTAITRAKTKVIFVGQKKALAMSIKNNDIDKRNTNLSLFIRNCNNKNDFITNNERGVTELNQIAL